MEGMEELVLLIGVRAKQVSLALVQLDLSGLNGSGHAPLLCNHGGNFSVCVMILLELSCDSPIFLSPGVVVHGSVHGVICQTFEKPVRELSFFIKSDALRGEEFMPVDRLIDPSSAQAVQPIQFDEWGKDVDGVSSIGDGDEEVIDVSFIFFIPFWPSCFSLPGVIPSVCVLLPVFVGCLQVSHVRLMLCQVLSSLLEYFKLFLIVMANLLIFSHNSCQSLCNEEELLSTR